ncbi:PTS sugar transporter subunit IIC [Lactococcus petauri]|uniref:PTS sugar transporter subunit IIC n=1 Tax=Lactococcus petauri TaxID=1940789 RepID=UPI0006219745|nr:PTS sugar transporter subunit IIC [Lactococcus petauri]KKF91490.1 PTS cellobiose transporter subunit IIC [Lactococcus garvieae]MDT2552200.1 PTS sugar transporter subunit IIC [Lactococcus petauri]MDT2562630.1 PTS sugar transporter subunit IIC [Lactococcus petauri]MDT2581665.1 PTS sugar transporter subunit IIC [Lactococcus petauri]
MNGITTWMEKHVVPIAGKIGSQKHLVALRDAFIGMLPATMAGALAAMLSAIIGTVPQAIQQLIQGTLPEDPDKIWTLVNTPILGDLYNIAGLINQGTLTVIGVIFAFSWGYNLSRAYGVNDLAGGIVAVSVLFAGLPNQMGKFTGALTDEAGMKSVEVMNSILGEQGLAAWKTMFSTGHLDAGAYFTILVMSTLAVVIYAKLMLADITIKMPDGVPPAVAKAFTAIIPSLAALFAATLIYYVIGQLTDDSVINLISQYIARPFQALSQNIVSVILVTISMSVLWFFGLHGPNVMAPALEGIWGPLQLENQALWMQIKTEGIRELIAQGATSASTAVDGQYVNLWVRVSWDAFAQFGGSGATFMLVVALLVFSKRKDYKMVGKLGLAPGAFNINEPILFGLPIVLNPIFIIPFTLVPLTTVIIGYVATMLHWVDPVVTAVPWVTPPIFNAFMATGFDWRAAVLAAFNLALTFFIWAPFVMAANKMEETEID